MYIGVVVEVMSGGRALPAAAVDGVLAGGWSVYMCAVEGLVVAAVVGLGVEVLFDHGLNSSSSGLVLVALVSQNKVSSDTSFDDCSVLPS